MPPNRHAPTWWLIALACFACSTPSQPRDQELAQTPPKAPGAIQEPPDVGENQNPHLPGIDDPVDPHGLIEDPSAPNNLVAAAVDGEPVPEVPEARELCDALHRLPERRWAACCNLAERPVAGQQADVCVEHLSAAVASGAIVIPEDPLRECLAQLSAAADGCPPTPHSIATQCDSVLLGTLAQASRCRSNFECNHGLHCQNPDAHGFGTCNPPAAIGAACGSVPNDRLAHETGLDPAQAHPACDGRCHNNVCSKPLAAGAACGDNEACGPGLACTDHRCQPLPPRRRDTSPNQPSHVCASPTPGR